MPAVGRIVALVDDLMMASRVETAGRASGWDVAFPATAEAFRAALAETPPALVLVGMSATRLPWESLVADIRRDPELAVIPVVAFGSHMDLPLRERALAAGCDRVVANSQVATDFPGVLRRMGLPD